MTVHPIDTEALRRLAEAATEAPWGVLRQYVFADEGRTGIAQVWNESDAEFIAAAREAIPALLDALAATQHRATRMGAQSAIRGRAVAIHRQRTSEAEARIKAVEEVLDRHETIFGADTLVPADRIRRALEGER